MNPGFGRGLYLTLFVLGLGMEIIIFGGIRHFDLFVSNAVWLDRGILFGVSLGALLLSAQILSTLHSIGFIPAATLVLLAGMWAWLGVVAAAFFLIFLVLFVLFAEVWVPIQLLAAGIDKLRKR
jgi:hypothetical protein